MNYWLPKLEQNANLGDGNKDAGKFFLMSHSVRTLADAIVVPPGNQLKIRSIPDVWARAMLYQDVFTTNFIKGNNTPQYIKGFIGQWRGLLAAIVLREHYGLNIGFNPINFRPAMGSFFDDVNILLPNAGQVLPEVNWNSPNLMILTYQDSQGNEKKVPLGMTSPSTLLYPAPPSDEISNIDWYSAQTGFSDPIYKLTTADKYVLYCWLIWAQTLIPIAADCLQKVINDYCTDLLYSLGAMMQNGMLNAGMVAFTPMDGNNDLAVQLLGAQYTSAGTDSGFNLTIDNTVIVLPQYEVAPETKFVYGIYDLYSYNKNSNYKTYIKRKIVKADYKIFEIDDIFYDKVVYFRSEEDKGNTPEISQKIDFFIERKQDGKLDVSTEPTGNTRSAVAMPVRESVIKYLNNPQIAVIKHTIVASVEFSVANRNITLSKAFTAQDTVQLENLPMTAVWPNVNILDWSFYYLFARPTKSQGSKKNYAFTSGHSDSGGNTHVTRLDKFPDYLILNENYEPVGYIPLKPVALGNASETDTLNIGIDFGTSSSTVYWSVTNAAGVIQRINPLKFDSNLAVVACGTHEVKELVREFMTPFANPVPFPTLLNVRPGNNTDPANIFENSNNFYFKSMPERNDEYLSGMKGQIKWDPNTNSASSFIGQLILQAALFARKSGYMSTKWLFSYPLSLRNPANFQSACGQACNSILRDTGLNNNNDKIKVSYRTESEASAEYFLNTTEYKSVARPILIVDIGGGSTDIYLHVEGKNNSLQSSLAIGAREMLIELLRCKSKYFHQKLRALVKEGTTGITNMQFVWSVKPKEEVSCGLVHDVGMKAGGGQAEEVILSGITGEMNNKSVTPISNLVTLIAKTEDGQEQIAWQQMDAFDEVKAFLTLYNAIPTDYNLKKIKMNDHFVDVNGQNNVVQILENTVKTNTREKTNGRRSPFIVAIQQISREILAQWH